MSRKHLQFIDSLECIVCGYKQPTHHHLLRVSREYLPVKQGEENFLIPKVKSKGMATKSDDRFTLPLCPKCHAQAHASGNDKAYFKSKGIDKPEEKALKLYKLTGLYDKAMDLIRWWKVGR